MLDLSGAIFESGSTRSCVFQMFLLSHICTISMVRPFGVSGYSLTASNAHPPLLPRMQLTMCPPVSSPFSPFNATSHASLPAEASAQMVLPTFCNILAVPSHTPPRLLSFQLPPSVMLLSMPLPVPMRRTHKHLLVDHVHPESRQSNAEAGKHPSKPVPSREGPGISPRLAVAMCNQ